jgi:hypothetical protein
VRLTDIGTTRRMQGFFVVISKIGILFELRDVIQNSLMPA